jgi:Domain of unknown function (DUF3883)
MDESFGWSRRRLRAAFWVAHVLGPEGEQEDVAHASWIDLPLGGEVDLAELRVAEGALIAAGLVRRRGSHLCSTPQLYAACAELSSETEELLLTVILEESRPLWLLTAAGEGDRLATELVPEEAAAVLAAAIPDPVRREAFLLARARSVDTNAREELGAQGEEAVVTACRGELTALGAHDQVGQVRRVSLVSDELGYDVTAPRIDGSMRRLEVKATRSASGNVNVVVTRNELTVGLSDPDWFLVLVRVDREGKHEVIGYSAGGDLEPLLPADRHGRGRWQAARLRLAVSAMEPGLPSASPAVPPITDVLLPE